MARSSLGLGGTLIMLQNWKDIGMSENDIGDVSGALAYGRGCVV